MPFTDPEKVRAYQREWERRNRPGRKGHARHPSEQAQFVAVDGEGWGKTYALLADSGGHSLVRPKGIPSKEAFEWLSYLPERNGKAIFLGFALSYDINHWLRDLSNAALFGLWERGQVRWEDWWLQWAPTRWFHVKHLLSSRSVRIYDCFPFFQTSFLKACVEWGVPVPEEVKAGKEARHQFCASDLPQIETYNRVELACLVELVGKLKHGLYGAGIELNQWYGAGAIATWLLTDNEARACLAITPPRIQEAALGAYFGGRIEAGRTGCIEGPITYLDIRSAYPDALRYLPNLARGKWIESKEPAPALGFHELGVYRVEWDFPDGWPYYPLPWRSKESAIYFPRVGRGWYWAPEAQTVLATAREFGGKANVLEGWRFKPRPRSKRAFPWVEKLFQQRQALGTKTGAGKALKLGLNALYGKMAQRTGVFHRVPTFRQYEYAGWVSSFVRATLWEMTWRRWEQIVSFATDGIFMVSPKKGSSGSRLGSWEISEYPRMEIVMAGVYRLEKPDGTWELFGRGFGKDGVPWDRVREGWERGLDKLSVKVARYHTLGECIHVSRRRPWVDRTRWRSWTNEPKELRLREPALKRAGKGPAQPEALFGFHLGAQSPNFDSTPYGRSETSDEERENRIEELADT